jgi:hypothetical protein
MVKGWKIGKGAEGKRYRVYFFDDRKINPAPYLP